MVADEAYLLLFTPLCVSFNTKKRANQCNQKDTADMMMCDAQV